MNGMSFLRSGAVAALVFVIAGSAPAQSGDKLVYADFQNLQNGRPVSARGGITRLNRYSENPANAPRYRGFEGGDPPGPAAAAVKGDDVAAAFEYELRIPNQWAGVNMEVVGQPEKDGKLVADDVSGYKYITMSIFAKGPKSIRMELITRDQGVTLESGYPQATFRIQPGFNTYKMELAKFRQPDWAQHLDLKKQVLAKLTSVTVGVFCEQCEMESGTIVVDNIAFEK